MKTRKLFNKKNYLRLGNKEIYNHEENSTDNYNINDINDINIYYDYQKIIFILILCICNFIIFNHNSLKKNPALIKLELLKESEVSKTTEISKETEEEIYFDQYDVNKYNEIKNKLLEIKCCDMWDNQKEFLNGIVRKLKPKKILEVGVDRGGSSIIILNAINDFEDAHLYSIDLNSEDKVGECVNKYFPEFLKKWSLFKGDIATEFLEQIGNNIDMAFIDTAHFEPGEILDFLIVLPFLKENAVVIFHDIANQITKAQYFKRSEYAPYVIFNAIRGKKYLPFGRNVLTHDIGAVKLDKNQSLYYRDYFRLLGGQWQYYPKEIHMKKIKNYFQKYYDEQCLIMFDQTSSFNKEFVKKYPMNLIYKFTSD